MKGITTLLLAILLFNCAFAGGMQLQFGTYVARAIGTSGRISIVCTGGSGSYNYQFNRLPAGWSASGNTITVPGINSISGQSYNLDIQIRDARTGQLLNTNIILTINGVRVNLAQGGAIGGTFGISGGVSVGGGAFGTGFTNNVVPTAQNIQAITQSSVSSLYENYQGLPSGASTPRINIPISSPAGNPSTYNPAPVIIANAQAQYNAARDANTITVDDVKRTAIFNRQINANKAVANLITIVTRLTANVNAANNDLIILNRLEQEAKNANTQCENAIYTLTDTQTKIENAIADRQTNIANINGQVQSAQPMLNGLKADLDRLITQRQAEQAKQSPNAAKLADLESQLSRCNQQRNQLENELQGLNSDIAGVRIDIQDTKDSAAAAPSIVSQINRQIPIIDNRIADLKSQLAAAEIEKTQLISDRNNAENLIRTSAAEVTRLTSVLRGLESRIPAINQRISDNVAECRQIESQLNVFRNQLAQNEIAYRNILTDIETQKRLIDNKQREINDLAGGINDIPNELKLLRAEYSRVVDATRRQYFLCQATADDVRRAQQNSEAMRVRLNTDSQNLKNANANLEAARAEKELADVAVEEIISVYTSALPFSIVPNGGSFQYAGTPLGNNPSGSPLGAVGSASTNQVVIGDLNTYLSSAYRSGVDPARPSTITSLYPLSVSTINTIAGSSAQNLYNFQCSANANSYGSGVVQSVQPGAIRLSTNSGPVNLQVSSCTNLQSINQGQVLHSNDMVYYRGQNMGNGLVNAHSLTCV